MFKTFCAAHAHRQVQMEEPCGRDGGQLAVLMPVRVEKFGMLCKPVHSLRPPRRSHPPALRAGHRAGPALAVGGTGTGGCWPGYAAASTPWPATTNAIPAATASAPGACRSVGAAWWCVSDSSCTTSALDTDMGNSTSATHSTLGVCGHVLWEHQAHCIDIDKCSPCGIHHGLRAPHNIELKFELNGIHHMAQ
jgi:hypothetical protein